MTNHALRYPRSQLELIKQQKTETLQKTGAYPYTKKAQNKIKEYKAIYQPKYKQIEKKPVHPEHRRYHTSQDVTIKHDATINFQNSSIQQKVRDDLIKMFGKQTHTRTNTTLPNSFLQQNALFAQHVQKSQEKVLQDLINDQKPKLKLNNLLSKIKQKKK